MGVCTSEKEHEGTKATCNLTILLFLLLAPHLMIPIRPMWLDGMQISEIELFNWSNLSKNGDKESTWLRLYMLRNEALQFKQSMLMSATSLLVFDVGPEEGLNCILLSLVNRTYFNMVPREINIAKYDLYSTRVTSVYPDLQL